MEKIGVMEKTYSGLPVLEIWLGQQAGASKNKALILLVSEVQNRRPAKLFFNGVIPFELNNIDSAQQWCDQNGGGNWTWSQMNEQFDIDQWLVDVEK